MPYRKILLGNEDVYHIVNRSIAKFQIFNNNNDYQRFTGLLSLYRFSNLPLCYSTFNRYGPKEKHKMLEKISQENKQQVLILAYCLMPNHFHLLLKQNLNNGISSFMRQLQDGYAKYFNIKHKRKGPLFESSFRAVKIENDEQLVHVSRYIHLNPVSSQMININQIHQYPWSSYNDYDYRRKNSFIVISLVLDNFTNIKEYKNFIKNNADYQRKLQNIKKLVLE